MKLLNAYTMAKYVTENGFRKYKEFRTANGEFRYQVKGLTDAEYSIFENEDLSDAERESLVETGGWVMLDGFTASAVKQVYEHLMNGKNAEANKAKFTRLPFVTLVNFAWKHTK